MAPSSRLSVGILGRSSVIFVDGSPRVLADPGSGVLESGIKHFDFSSLEEILLTRLEIDCTADLPSVVMHLYARNRNHPVAITGPAGEPGAEEFVRLLFGADGAWRYLNTLNGLDTVVRETPSALSDLAVYSIPVQPALEELDVSLCSVAVPDGLLPAVAFRVDCADESIVLSGNISTPTAPFIALASDCDALVVDRALDAKTVGQIVTKCRARTVLRV
jgi:ribonuclease BN (tRNA processing enzyme)